MLHSSNNRSFSCTTFTFWVAMSTCKANNCLHIHNLSSLSPVSFKVYFCISNLTCTTFLKVHSLQLYTDYSAGYSLGTAKCIPFLTGKQITTSYLSFCFLIINLITINRLYVPAYLSDTRWS